MIFFPPCLCDLSFPLTVAQDYTKAGTVLAKVIKGGFVLHLKHQRALKGIALMADWQMDAKSSNTGYHKVKSAIGYVTSDRLYNQ